MTPLDANPFPDPPSPNGPESDLHERQLWHRFARSRNGTTDACPSPTLLAGLIDGTIKGQDREAAERHVAACSRCRETIADVESLLAAQVAAPMTAPAAVLARAKALVRDRARPIVVVRRLDFRTLGRWGLSAAASIAVCLLGYQAGARSSAAPLEQSDLVSELTFGVPFDGTTELDLLLTIDDDASEDDASEDDPRGEGEVES